MLKTKSVHSPIAPRSDGLRVLATRLRGRGMKSDRYDVWMANLGPSERLLRSALPGMSDEKVWREFARRYKAEMLSSGDIDASNVTIKNHGQKFTLRLLKRLAEKANVTVMCHCAEDEQHCHRHLLKALILRS
ncbi:MAG TPA: DUF488 family protein [Polyangiaceae bacterium]|nr:DUF488 family protein [Polyangiaceae bacterium]